MKRPHRFMPRLFTTLTLSAFSFIPVYSQQTIVEEQPEELKVKYIDGDNEALYFNLKYINESGSDFKLMALTETGEVLFQHTYSGRKFKKNLKLPRLTDTDNITFLIKPVKEDVHLSYQVAVTDKVEDKTALVSR